MTVHGRNNFNGDGRSDILWRDGAGVLTIWDATISGGFAPAQVLNNWTTDRSLAFSGDFNGDGRGDILLLSASVVYPGWQIGSGGFPFDFQEGYGVPAGRSIVATADFNGDGRTDVLWRDANGLITNWIAENSNSFWYDFVTPYQTFRPNDAIMTVSVDLAWNFAATGDFNGDGKADILWRNDNGAIFDFVGTAAGGVLNNGDNSWRMIDNGWHLVGTGDFNGDGRDDILFRNDNGTIIDFLANENGGFVDNSVHLNTTVGTDWFVAGIGDYNGDGRADILWRNVNGAIFDFLGTVNGGVVNNGDNSWTMVPTTWQVQDSSVHDPFQPGPWDY